MDEIAEKFIDLGVDDNQSDFGQEIPHRQERLQQQLEKLNFRFKTKCLDLPEGSSAAEAQLELTQETMASLQSSDSAMGSQLDKIFSLMTEQTEASFRGLSIIVEHRWDAEKSHFANN